MLLMVIYLKQINYLKRKMYWWAGQEELQESEYIPRYHAVQIKKNCASSTVCYDWLRTWSEETEGDSG